MAPALDKPLPNRRLLGLLWPHWKSVFVALGSLILLTAVNLATPMLVSMVFNDVFPERDWPLLRWILVGLLACFLLRNLFFYQSKFTAVRVGEDVCFNLRRRLFERIQQLRLSYTRSLSPGKITSKVMNDSMQIQQFIADVLPKTLQAALLFLGILIITYSINWQLALASTFMLPLHLYVFHYFGRRIKRTSRESQEHIDFATGNIIETLLGVEVVKGFTGEDRGNRAFTEAMEDSRASHLNSYRYVVLQKVCADLLVGFGMLALIGLGAYQVIGRPYATAMSAGDFIAFFWYIRLLYPTVIDLMSSGAKLSKVGASVDRVYELLDVDEGTTEGEGLPMPEMRGHISFEQVGFTFDDVSNTLEGISFEVKAGQVCAITGHSGAGKSTLVSLVPLLLRPSEGSIVIDGVNALDISTRDLRRNIGIVFQDCFLFHASILENLRYAKARASEKEIRQICVLTEADEFIQRLPNGYHTVVGDGGLALSRGQKQLITITRAMIKDPKMLILDESTASLDSELEEAVIPTILKLMQGRTTLMITHNPKLLKHANMEIELTQGRLTAQKKLTPSLSKASAKVATSIASCLLMVGLCLGALFTTPSQSLAQAGGNVIDQIATQRLRLSYTDPQRCLDVLKIYGISTGITGNAIKKEQLPVVVAIPSTTEHNTIPNTDKSFPLTDADPLNELLIFYDRFEPSQLSRVARMIREEIDIPARQIMIEAMVLEISEIGLDRLGVEWNLAGPSSNFSSLQLGDVVPNLNNISDQLVVGMPKVFGEFTVDILALMSAGEAEVLSRPSVLTLNNRMAFINVARKIPIAETKFQGNNNVSTVSFRSETVGIQLAVRPRINDEGQEVSMQINATVSAVVPNEDVVVLDNDGRQVALAPTISIREVRTYARIANNTPFIIGGLIAKDDLRTRQSMPILGSIPYLGRLFGSEQTDQLKREVIIVITPFVLPEEVKKQTAALDKIVGRFLPKGEDTFDSFGNELFRDAYRIRDEDVFELNFLIDNEHLKQLQAKAELAVDQDYALRLQYPFSSFANGRVPGENILVYRQMYEVIKRIKMDERVDAARSLVFEPKADSDEGFEVSFLDKLLLERARAHANAEQAKKIKTIEDVWDYFEDKALTITYRDYGKSEDLGKALESPVPAIEIVDIPDSQAYERLLWELNQHDAEGNMRHSIILHDAADMRRLKHAIVLRDTVTLNAVDRTLTLENFSIGRFLLLPTRDLTKVDLVDGEVARLFFLTERYYDALRQALREASSALETELKKMGIE